MQYNTKKKLYIYIKGIQVGNEWINKAAFVHRWHDSLCRKSKTID